MRPFASLLDLVLPPRCLACGQLLADSRERFCTPCEVTVIAPDHTLAPLAGAGAPGGPLGEVLTAHELGGAIRTAIHRFKYRGGDWMARALARSFDPDGRSWDAVVPVPLHAAHRRQRGYNQATLLARAVARRLDRPLILALRRTRRVAPQAGSTATQRAENVRRAFTAHRPRAVTGRRILLVDDVITTGATVTACARVLRRAGAAGVDAWALAREP